MRRSPMPLFMTIFPGFVVSGCNVPFFTSRGRVRASCACVEGMDAQPGFKPVYNGALGYRRRIHLLNVKKPATHAVPIHFAVAPPVPPDPPAPHPPTQAQGVAMLSERAGWCGVDGNKHRGRESARAQNGNANPPASLCHDTPPAMKIYGVDEALTRKLSVLIRNAFLVLIFTDRCHNYRHRMRARRNSPDCSTTRDIAIRHFDAPSMVFRSKAEDDTLVVYPQLKPALCSPTDALP